MTATACTRDPGVPSHGSARERKHLRNQEAGRIQAVPFGEEGEINWQTEEK